MYIMYRVKIWHTKQSSHFAIFDIIFMKINSFVLILLHYEFLKKTSMYVLTHQRVVELSVKKFRYYYKAFKNFIYWI